MISNNISIKQLGKSIKTKPTKCKTTTTCITNFTDMEYIKMMCYTGYIFMLHRFSHWPQTRLTDWAAEMWVKLSSITCHYEMSKHMCLGNHNLKSKPHVICNKKKKDRHLEISWPNTVSQHLRCDLKRVKLHLRAPLQCECLSKAIPHCHRGQHNTRYFFTASVTN